MSLTSAAQTSAELRNQIEYSKSNRSSCKSCKRCIESDAIRVGHETKSRLFDGYEVSWYHLKCAKFEQWQVYFINQLKHFELLRWNDYLKVKELLSDTTTIENALQKQNYNDEVWEIKDKLLKELKPAQVKTVYTANYSLEGLSPAYTIHSIADGLAYGRIGPCPTCNNLSVQYDGNHYYCKGWITSFTKCDWYGNEIKRYKFKIPKVPSAYLKDFTFGHSHPYQELTDYIAPPSLSIGKTMNDEENDESSSSTSSTSSIIIKKKLPKKGSITLKLDESYKGGSNGEIAIETSEIYGFTPYNVSLVFTDMVYGSNSFYKMQIIKCSIKKYDVYRRWGRIGTNVGGDTTHSFSTIGEALKLYEEVFLDKTGYEWNDRGKNQQTKIAGKSFMVDLEDDQGDDDSSSTSIKLDNISTSIPSNLPQETQDFVKMLYNFDHILDMLKNMKFDVNKMPLGKISQKQIKAGYATLTELQDLLLLDEPPRAKIINASNVFYTLVPHNFGHNVPPPIDNMALLKEKIKLIDTMADIEVANNLRKLAQQAGNSIDSSYDQLKTTLTPIDPNSFTFNSLVDIALSTNDTSTNFIVKQIFEVNRIGESDSFSNWDYNPNKLLLWHGSRLSNWIGILGNGLRIAPPAAPKTGYRFGKGIYFADSSSVSLGYCATTPNYPRAVLALANVALGSSDPVSQDTYMETANFGFQSTKALGMRGPVNYDNFKEFNILRGPVVSTGLTTSCSHNEYVIYDTTQVNIKYLFIIEVQDFPNTLKQ